MVKLAHWIKALYVSPRHCGALCREIAAEVESMALADRLEQVGKQRKGRA